MQLVSGGSIADRLPLPAGEAVAIAITLRCARLRARRGMIHRDIKPENVLIERRRPRQAVTTSASRACSTRRPTTVPSPRPSMVLGTPGYMAPEARAGRAARPAHGRLRRRRAAQAHMLTGRHPDGAGGRRASGAAAPAVPPAMQPLIARAMAIDPATANAESATALGRRAGRARRAVQGGAAGDDDLPPEERVWRGAVALLAAVATAIAIYAALVSRAPHARWRPATRSRSRRSGPAARRRTRADARALRGVADAGRRRRDRDRARGATACCAGTGALAGLERHAPDRPLAGTRRVLRLGVGLFALFLLHQLLAHTRAAALVSYIPVIGGCFELLMLVRFWDAALEARQTNRPLAREPLPLAGSGAVAVPADLQHGAADRTLRCSSPR